MGKIKQKSQGIGLPQYQTERTFAEQVRMLYGNTSIAIIGGLLTASACVFLLRDSASSTVLAAWFSVHVTIALIRGLMLWRFGAASASEAAFRPRYWAWMYAGVALASGLAWGALPWLAMDVSSLSDTLVTGLAIYGMVASSIGSHAAFLPAFFAFSAPAGGMLGMRLIVEGGELATIGVFILVYLAANVFFAVALNRIVRTSIARRFERDALLADVEQKRFEAERANRDKSRFLASASHDLRQPLHALNLYLDTMGAESDPEKIAGLLARARASGKTLGELLNTLLDVSQLDAKSVHPEYKVLPLLVPFEDCINEFAPLAREKGIELRMRYPAGAYVRTDPVLFGRMLRNLVSNAVQHTQSGKVLLAARRRGANWLVEVWDTGPGIAEKDLDNIFTEFYQLDNPERDREKGLGLGLAIVRRLSGLLDHPVSVCSMPGRGSRFSVSVPVCEAPADALRFTGSAREGCDLGGMFVLLVDDDAVILDAMRGWLRPRGCEALAATGGDDMLALLAAGEHPRPDVIVADYRLRGAETGLDVVQKLRARCGAGIPAVIISGDTAKDVVHRVQFAGCRFLSKPVNEDVLVRTLAACRQARVRTSGRESRWPAGPP